MRTATCNQVTPDSVQRYRVFLASPGDVRPHRDFVRAFFADYNIQHLAPKNVELQVIDWENWSALGVGETQKRITRDLLDRFRPSFALVIGILGRRFGSPTTTHDSGTEEEFEWALDCWKRHGHPEIKWFFLETEDLRIPTNKQERAQVLEQWDRVCDFRERLLKGDEATGDPPFYFGTFHDLAGFESVFRRDLNLWLGAAERPWNTDAAKAPRKPQRKKRAAGPALPRGQAPVGGPGLLSAYLDRLREETGKITLIGLGQDIQVELDILESYVPLQTVAARSLVSEQGEFVHRPEPLGRGFKEESPIDVNGIFLRAAEFGQRGAVLLGDPGAGKTTVARQLVFSLASGRVSPKTLGLTAGVAPVLLRFRNLEASDARDGFNVFLERELAPCYEDSPERRRAAREAILSRPSLLWVFDGLDEVVEDRLRGQARDWIVQLLKDRPGDHFLITSRFQGYRGKAEMGGAFVEFHVQPLEPDQSQRFVRRWYMEVCRKLRGPGPRAREEAETLILSLIEILEGPAFRVGRMAELPANPLLLTIVCVVHHQDRNLPRRRADLYARCVRVLLEHWRMEIWQKQGAQSFDAPSAERVLAELAWRMHQEQGRRAMDAGELARLAEATLKKIPDDAGLGRDGAAFLARMRDRCGVMAMVGDGTCAFLHLTFQEYLAALHADSRSLAADLAGHFGETWWREATLLAMAIGRPEFTAAFFDAVLNEATWKEHRDLLGQCLDEARNPELSPFVRRLEEGRIDRGDRLLLMRLLAARELPELAEVAERIAVQEAEEMQSLAMQIAGRPVAGAQPPVAAEKAKPGTVHVDQFTGFEFVWIPPGTFTMGGPGDRDGKPIHEVRLTKGFWLGRYPVTNQDYRKFLEAEKYRTPDYWTRREFNADQQPVVGVDWEDAQAFCRWAGCRLPTEAEWEYACRAGAQGAYCFGDEEERLGQFAWYGANSSGKLHAVGQKNPNLWGVYDMHGNVWEWCEDWYGDYPEEPVIDPTGPARGSIRVVRGGGWFDPAVKCRSAIRSRLGPSYRYYNLGFRVVLSRSSVQEQVQE